MKVSNLRLLKRCVLALRMSWWRIHFDLLCEIIDRGSKRYVLLRELHDDVTETAETFQMVAVLRTYKNEAGSPTSEDAVVHAVQIRPIQITPF